MMVSLITYILVISLMLLCSILYNNRGIGKIKFYSPEILTLFIIYVLFCGLRFDVGFDYREYFSIYKSSSHYSSFESLDYESLWALFTWTLSKERIHFSIYFGIIAAVQFFFIIKAFGNKAYLLPSLIFSYFVWGYFLSFQNVLRQNVVMAIFLYIVMRHRDINFILYVLCCFVASFIHKSSLIMILLYPLMKWQIPLISHYRISVIIFLLCVLIGFTKDILSMLVSNPMIYSLILSSDYGVYAQDQYIYMGTSKTMGLGFLIKVMLNLIIIFRARSMDKFFSNDNTFKYCFQIFYIGICLQYLVPTSMVLGRPILYLTIFTIPVATYFVYYVFHSRHRQYSISRAINVYAIAIAMVLFVTDYFIAPEGNKAEYHTYLDKQHFD